MKKIFNRYEKLVVHTHKRRRGRERGFLSEREKEKLGPKFFSFFTFLSVIHSFIQRTDTLTLLFLFFSFFLTCFRGCIPPLSPPTARKESGGNGREGRKGLDKKVNNSVSQSRRQQLADSTGILKFLFYVSFIHSCLPASLSVCLSVSLAVLNETSFFSKKKRLRDR